MSNRVIKFLNHKNLFPLAGLIRCRDKNKKNRWLCRYFFFAHCSWFVLTSAGQERMSLQAEEGEDKKQRTKANKTLKAISQHREEKREAFLCLVWSEILMQYEYPGLRLNPQPPCARKTFTILRKKEAKSGAARRSSMRKYLSGIWLCRCERRSFGGEETGWID